MVDVVGRLEDGTVFLDTHKMQAPLAFQVGATNKCEFGAVHRYCMNCLVLYVSLL